MQKATPLPACAIMHLSSLSSPTTIQFRSDTLYLSHAYCRALVLQYACDKYNVLLKNCIVVGDDRDDRCILAHAGKGVAFCTGDELLEKIAYFTIKEKAFKPLLHIA